MPTSQEIFENALVPILGICVLIPLFVAIFIEPRRDYSRRVYSLMLFACVGILATEACEWVSNGRAVGIWLDVYRTTQCLLFVFLAAACFLWTVYSYYWFNGHGPSGRVLAALALGPTLDVAFLVANLFTGSIYSISAGALYARGPAFTAFILFCYVYLIVAIMATAMHAPAADQASEERGARLFLLFFVFPVVGPVLQYALPEIPVMGISQAISLLAIYVAVQQRTNESYAVEMARLQDESARYERSMERLLSIDPGALSSFRLNLTKNTFANLHERSGMVGERIRHDTMDGLVEAVASLVTEQGEAAAFRTLFSRENLLARFSENQAQLSFDYHRMLDSGESHSVRTNLTMLSNPTTRDVEAIAYTVDVDTQEKDERVISAITTREYDYIALIDVETRRIHFRRAARKDADSFGFGLGDYDQVIKRTIVETYGIQGSEERFRKVAFDVVRKALAQEPEYSIVFSCPSPTGDEIQKRTTFQYLDDEQNEILFFRNDITEEMRQECEHADALQTALLQAEHANAMKTEFLSNLSHDMRTPLNAVLVYAALSKTEKDPGKARGYLDGIEQSGRILLSLVNDTLDLSRIETGAVTLRPEPTPCQDVVSKIILTIKPMTDAKHIRLVVDNSRAVMATIDIDALRVQEVFINLLSNAAKFTPEGGTVTFAIESEEREGVIRDRVTVSDTGCGMSPEFVPKMFEPFSQEDPASSAGVSGSGLGLSIVKRLVDLMGGTIEVKSEQGRGTAVTVCLDFRRIDTGEGAKRPPEGRLEGRTILLAEDNAMNTEVAKALLEGAGAEVVCAKNGKVACDLFSGSGEGSFDAILMDLRMPVMGGLEAARTIRGMDRPDAAAIPIVAVSADAFDDNVQASLEAGMDGHVAKPIDPDRLFGLLDELGAGHARG
ncbi:MAG: ATP-binding protein [Atopobiaceae bacterium]|nr:ATP-binding protein [Atopobiaceae bacterium]